MTQDQPSTSMSVVSKVLWLWFSLTLLSVLAFLPALWGEYQLDTISLLRRLPPIVSWQSFDTLWRLDPSRFITHLTVTQWFDDPLNAFGQRMINLFVHVLNVGLAIGISWRLFDLIDCLSAYPSRESDGSGACKGGEVRFESIKPNNDLFRLWFAGVAALIFALHPLQAATVPYVAQRGTLLAVFGYLAVLWLWMVSQRQGGRWRYFLALLIYAVATMTKPIVITVPLILSAWCFFDAKLWRCRLRNFFLVLPFWTIAFLVPLWLSLWHYQADWTWQRMLSVTAVGESISRWQYLLTQVHVLWIYLQRFWIPVGLRLDSFQPVIHQLDVLTTIKALGLLLLVGAVWGWGRKRIVLRWIVVWLLVTLALESSVFPIRDVIFEHRIYLSLLAGGWLIAYLIVTHIKQSASRKFLLVVLTTGLFVLTITRANLWRDGERFLLREIHLSPQQIRNYLNLGLLYLQRGQLALAENVLKASLLQNSQAVQAMNTLAVVFIKQKQYAQAQPLLREALRIKPDFGDAWMTLGNLQWYGGNMQAAVNAYTHAIQHQAWPVEAYVNRAKVRFHLRQWHTALADVDRALESRPNDLEATRMKALILEALGRHDEARTLFQNLLLRFPSSDQVLKSWQGFLARTHPADETHK